MEKTVVMRVYVPLGQLYKTQGVSESISDGAINLALYRHCHGDWGDICADDWQANNSAIKNGHRLLSVYKDTSGQTFWIITEHDRSSTTILLPEEY